MLVNNTENLRIAWLFPSLAGGNYWHPVLCEFSKIFKQTIVYTGNWSGFSSGYEDTFKIQVVGKTSYVPTIQPAQSQEGYGRGFINVSPRIVTLLYQFKPHIIFASGFSLWTLLSVLLKPLGRWRIVILYEGSSPNVDYQDSPIRSWVRRAIVKSVDAFITNTSSGSNYLTKILQAQENQVFSRPYQVPDSQALLKLMKVSQPSDEINLQRPVFLFIGQLIQRKGLEYLLKACVILQSWGYVNYTLMVLGQGPLRDELEVFSKQHNLNIQWIGWVDYGSIGAYFQNADIFVLPTLEDTWGMVVMESMLFGKPVMCSKYAGAAEMIIDGVNGYLFNPKEPEELAKLMSSFIDNPNLIPSMGKESQRLIAQHTPVAAAQFLAEVTERTLQYE